jgi:hypothetical protein
MSQQELLGLFLVLHADDDRHGSPVAGDYDRPALGGFEEGAKLGFHFRD